MKLEKIIIISILVITILLSSMTPIFAASFNPEYYKPSYQAVNEKSDAMVIASKIISVVSIVAGIIFVTTILLLGIRYMIGSLEEKASYKKTMVPVLIGGILIFGISAVLRFVLSIVPQEIS